MKLKTLFRIEYTSLALSLAWLLYIFSLNEIPPDIGDGLMHFFYAQASWTNPEYFLHHWNKPVFTLLTSSFAQAGFTGMVVFNLIVHVSTILIGFRILRRIEVSPLLQMLLPLLMLIPYDVSTTILSGLTEPLFNLATVGALYLFMEKKYIAFAILVSFIPFMRSEGQFVVVVALILLLYCRAFKAIPMLFFGFLIYAIIGYFVFQDFWWYFTQNPYKMSNDGYGSGSWTHYFENYTYFIGLSGLIVVGLGLLSFSIMIFQKRWNDVKFTHVLFGASIFLAILIIHAYFWATGKSGSIGLTRVATQGLPTFLVICLFLTSRISFINSSIGTMMIITFAGYMIFSLAQFQFYKKEVNPMERQAIETAKFLKTQKNPSRQVYAFMPLLAYELKVNPFLNNSNLHFYTCSSLQADLANFFKPGDFIVRDSHFGNVEANLPLSEIQKFPELVKVKEFISSQQVDDRFNEVEGFTIYQYIPLHKQIKSDFTVKKTLSDIVLNLKSTEEFKDINTLLPKQKEDAKLSFEIMSTSEELVLVFDYNNTEDYSNMKLDPTKALSPTLLIRSQGTTKLYIWNPKKSSGTVSIKNIVLEQSSFHPIMH